MKLVKLSDERIKQLVEKTENKIILRYREHNSSPNLDDYKYLTETIKNINNIDDKKHIFNEIKYWSCSSNYWEGVIPLLEAYEERIGRPHF